jgi:hypothetical protein
MGVDNIWQFAELWMGAQPSALALDVSLCDWITRNPAVLSPRAGAATSLLLLFKVLSIHVSQSFFLSFSLIDHLQASMQVLSLVKALSIQAHPDRDLTQAKKNGLDYLFHLYEQCRVFLLQVQTIAKMGRHKSPTKVYFA